MLTGANQTAWLRRDQRDVESRLTAVNLDSASGRSRLSGCSPPCILRLQPLAAASEVLWTTAFAERPLPTLIHPGQSKQLYNHRFPCLIA